MNPLLAPYAARNPVLAHHLLGASTGYMADERGQWPQLVSHVASITPRAIELSALSGPELEPLLMYFDGHAQPLPFIYVSVHGPAKNWSSGEVELARQLTRLPAQVESVVLHPDTLKDLEPLQALGPLVVMENLDHRPATGRDVRELTPYFKALPEAGFCLDVAHVSAIDPSMKLAHDLLDAFGARLRQLHISSFVRETALHVPLTEEDVERFASVLRRCRGVPWILEAPLPGLDA